MIESNQSFRQRIFTPGVIAMITATLGFVIMQSLIKSGNEFHIFQLIFFRSVVTSIICMYVLTKSKVSLFGNKQHLLILRAICGIVSMSLFFITIQRMPFGASVSLKYLSPIFTAIFAAAILKEKVKNIQWLFFATAFLGVVLLKGFDTRIDTLNLFLGIGGAFFGGIVYVIIRKIGQLEHPLVIVNYFMFSASVISGILMIPHWISPDWKQLLTLLAIGGFGFIGQKYMTLAFQLELASRVAPIKYSEIIYSLIIGWVWFGESYTLLGMVGMFIIIGSMVGNVYSKEHKKST